jgi:hypothetical protein
MAWDGEERRKEVIRNHFCSQHIGLATDIATIKEKTLSIDNKVSGGNGFRVTIIISMIGWFIVLVAQITAFSYFMGNINKQVEVNTLRLNILEKVSLKK